MASSYLSYIPHSLRPSSHLPPSADRLIRQVTIACLDLLNSNTTTDPSSSSNGVQYIIRHISQLSPSSSFRTPQFSVLGLASLLLGISSTLMLFGSFAFMVGFMIIPFIFPVIAVACIGALHGALKSPLILDPSPYYTSFSYLSSLSAVITSAIFSLGLSQYYNRGSANAQKPGAKLE